MSADPDRLLFFAPNRVWRCYTGGLLLERFEAKGCPADGQFPEEWLASTTPAMNGQNQQHPTEGLSCVRNPDGSRGPLFTELLSAHRAEWLGPGAPPAGSGVGVLCKFLDAAIRLPIQCHPDRAFAHAHFGSEHGKEEAWFILGVRNIDGRAPYLLMGFKPGTTRAAFARAVAEQDVAAMESMLHRFEARPGDAYIIPGRFPHAIGPGVFLLEVQEPTDWVVQPERRIGSVTLDEPMMWGPLDRETGLDCFDYAGAAEAHEIRKRILLRARNGASQPGRRLERLIDSNVSRSFRVDRLTVQGACEFEPDTAYHIGIVVQGNGTIEVNGSSASVRRGVSYFAPHTARTLRITPSETPLEIFIVSGPDTR